MRVALEGNPAHYLIRVMRVTHGDTVILCDDVTGEWAAQVTAPGKRAVCLETVQMLRPREAVPDLWLCAAPIKKGRIDLVAEKACELGAAVLQPVLTRRAVVDKLNLANPGKEIRVGDLIISVNGKSDAAGVTSEMNSATCVLKLQRWPQVQNQERRRAGDAAEATHAAISDPSPLPPAGRCCGTLPPGLDFWRCRR